MATRKTTSKVAENLTGTIKPPISFKEFSKDPVKGLLFIVLIAIGYLYVDGKMTNKDIVIKQDIRIQKLETKVDTLTAELQKVVGEAASTNAKMSVLETLGKIPK